MDAKHIANGVLARQPNRAIQNYNSDLPSVMDFTLQALSKVFNEDDGSWERNDQSV
jgi:hypothetical protein